MQALILLAEKPLNQEDQHYSVISSATDISYRTNLYDVIGHWVYIYKLFIKLLMIFYVTVYKLLLRKFLK